MLTVYGLPWQLLVAFNLLPAQLFLKWEKTAGTPPLQVKTRGH